MSQQAKRRAFFRRAKVRQAIKHQQDVYRFFLVDGRYCGSSHRFHYAGDGDIMTGDYVQLPGDQPDVIPMSEN